MSDSKNRKEILNLGSGKDTTTQATVTVDLISETNPDVVHDLNKLPWPLKNDFFDEVYAFDVVEHLEDLVKTMEEIHRVSKNGAKVTITTPHYSCSNSYTDPTHRQRLGYFSFDYFTGENQHDFYTKVRFKKVETHLTFYPKFKNKLIWRFANKHPQFYEEHFAWILPAWMLKFELEVVK